jgi:hypothetical protein
VKWTTRTPASYRVAARSRDRIPAAGMDDPRRLLELAAEQRLTCEVLPRHGAWRRAQVIRVEKGGVVIRVSGTPLGGGVDVRCWIRIDGVPYRFEASVLRGGVPVPDRSQNGVLLGFLDGWQRVDHAAGTLVLDVLPPNGSPVSLMDGEARIVDLGPSEWTVSAPTRFTLVFVEQGSVRLRLGVPDRPAMEVQARVHRLAHADGHLLYALHIERVGDPAAYQEIVDALRAALDL